MQQHDMAMTGMVFVPVAYRGTYEIPPNPQVRYRIDEEGLGKACVE